MILSDFAIAKDFIALERGAEYFDLHNCFDFKSLTYDVSLRNLVLRWVKSEGDWVKAEEPELLTLTLDGVYLFKASQRDPALPFTEDDCLESIGFIWDDMEDEMNAFTSNEQKDGCTQLCLSFMSGFSFKVGADLASLQTNRGA